MTPRARILFVDSDGANREALRMALEGHRYQVVCAATEQEAVGQLQGGDRPDLLLLDLAPSAQGASQFILELKQSALKTSIPLIVLYPSRPMAHNPPVPDVDASLEKPVEFEDLLNHIRRHCRNSPEDSNRAVTPDPGERTARLPAAANRCNLSCRRVLIVEDNRDGAESLRVLLTLLGHQVRVAHTGPDGIQIAQEWQPDIVLCDIGLPGFDGYEVASRLRRHPSTARSRLIAITGYGSEEARRRSEESGFDVHLTKPANPNVLLKFLTAAEGAA